MCFPPHPFLWEAVVNHTDLRLITLDRMARARSRFRSALAGFHKARSYHSQVHVFKPTRGSAGFCKLCKVGSSRALMATLF